jgi:hypothetical protein
MNRTPGQNRLAYLVVSLRWLVVGYGALVQGYIVATAQQSQIVIGNAAQGFPESLSSIANETLYRASIANGVVYRFLPGDGRALFTSETKRSK